MKRELHLMVLALLGSTLVRLAWSGDYTRYVRPGFKPYLVASGVVVLLIAALGLAEAIRTFLKDRHAARDRASDAHEPSGEKMDDHGHHHPARTEPAWLLAVPMVVLLLLAPPALGTYSAGREGSALGAAAQTKLPPLPDGDPVPLSLVSYAARAVFDHGVSLSGRSVVLSGFVMPGQTGGWYLARMVINCCAADAQPIKVGLTGTVPTGLAANDWIQVTGTYTTQRDRDAVNGAAIPYLIVVSSQQIPPPQQQYES